MALGRGDGQARLSVRPIFSARVHQAGITGVAFLGDYMVTSSLDRSIRVWRKVRSGLGVGSRRAPELPAAQAAAKAAAVRAYFCCGDVGRGGARRRALAGRKTPHSHFSTLRRSPLQLDMSLTATLHGHEDGISCLGTHSDIVSEVSGRRREHKRSGTKRRGGGGG